MKLSSLSGLGLGLGLALGIMIPRAQADVKNPPLSPCGIFQVEGLLRESSQYPKHLELVTDQNTRSERRIVLGKMSAQELQSVRDIQVAGKLRLYHFCVGDCFGEWLGTERMLAPTESPKSFAAAPASIRIKTESCLTVEESKKKVIR